MQPILAGAIVYAAREHSHQKRKNLAGTPYINHPLDVVHLLACANVMDTEIQAAGVLHDVVEDCGVTFNDLRLKFGDRIASIVMECSDDKTLPKVERKRLQIEHAKTASYGARVVKMADKVSNLSGLLKDPPVGWTAPQIVGYATWSWAVISAMPADTNLILYEQAAAMVRAIKGDLTCNQVDLEAYYEAISADQ